MRIKKLLAVGAALAVAALGSTAVAANAATAGQDLSGATVRVNADNGHGHGEGKGLANGHSKSHGKSHAHGHANGDSDDSGSDDSADNGNNGNHGEGHAHGQGNGGNGGQGNGGNGGKGDAGDPPGNNGTVKIAPLGDFDGIPNNTPHPGCSFLVEWYGYDEGADIISTVTFAMQAPTSDVGLTVDGPSQVFVGGDPASGAGTDTGLDGRQQYTLSFDGAPHPKQGYHVKLTVNTPYSQGADKKSKVFWVSGCEQTSGTETPGTGDTGDTGTSGDTGGTDTQVAGEQASGSSNDTSDTQVAGQQANAGTRLAAGGNATLPTQVNAGADVLDFVASPVPLLVIALGLALGVIGLARRSRRA